jgi:succinate dehydrogenase / fumarate reductase membrane anchor subunit
MRESKLWFWHILSAAIILVILGVHMAIMHMGASLSAIGLGFREPVAAAAVFQRSKQLIFMATYIILLGAALFHGLYGLRSMLFELSLSKTLEKAISRVCALAGICLFVYGSYAAVYVFTMKGVTP